MTAPMLPRSGRREFQLPRDDAEALRVGGYYWEAAIVQGVQWLFVQDFQLPVGFTAKSVALAIRIPPGYPTAALDMIYVSPAIYRIDGKVIAALSLATIDGCAFQQWSRHYTAQNPWIPDVSDIGSHLRAAAEWFLKALT